jgi:hypothetical protein
MIQGRPIGAVPGLLAFGIILGQAAGLGNKAEVAKVGQLVFTLGEGDNQAVESRQDQENQQDNRQARIRTAVGVSRFWAGWVWGWTESGGGMF